MATRKKICKKREPNPFEAGIFFCVRLSRFSAGLKLSAVNANRKVLRWKAESLKSEHLHAIRSAVPFWELKKFCAARTTQFIRFTNLKSFFSVFSKCANYTNWWEVEERNKKKTWRKQSLSGTRGGGEFMFFLHFESGAYGIRQWIFSFTSKLSFLVCSAETTNIQLHAQSSISCTHAVSYAIGKFPCSVYLVCVVGDCTLTQCHPLRFHILHIRIAVVGGGGTLPIAQS